VSWWLGAVPTGLAMIRKFRPAAIWSTYPVATAHLIGHTLHRVSGLPWIADFRDPMAQEGYPEDPRMWRSFRKIEERALRRASFSVFATPGAAKMYRDRYPDVPGARIVVIENGYDEESFSRLEVSAGPLVPGSITLLHSGIVYPSERDPTRLFEALRTMLDSGRLKPRELRLRLRASANDALLGKMIDEWRIAEVVELAPPLPYRDALVEMMRADGLLILQASNCNDQIPAKAYEYLRCRRPIVALTDPGGDTAKMLRTAGVRRVARLDSANEIAQELRTFVDEARSARAALPDDVFVAGASRLNRTQELSALLDRSAA